MSGQAQNDIATASGRKDAVRKAFNQEYMATQQAMSQAAERARAQVLDQKNTIANHATDVKAGAQAPQPPIGGTNTGQAHAQPQAATGHPPQGAPHMASDPNQYSDQQIMFDIANEIRNIITREIDLRMQALSAKVETALANAFPPQDQESDTQHPKTRSGNRRSGSSKKT